MVVLHFSELLRSCQGRWYCSILWEPTFILLPEQNKLSQGRWCWSNPCMRWEDGKFTFTKIVILLPTLHKHSRRRTGFGTTINRPMAALDSQWSASQVWNSEFAIYNITPYNHYTMGIPLLVRADKQDKYQILRWRFCFQCQKERRVWSDLRFMVAMEIMYYIHPHRWLKVKTFKL